MGVTDSPRGTGIEGAGRRPPVPTANGGNSSRGEMKGLARQADGGRRQTDEGRRQADESRSPGATPPATGTPSAFITTAGPPPPPGETIESCFPRIFDRLAQIPGYTWRKDIEPFHSSYDNWHVFGEHQVSVSDRESASTSSSARSSSSTRPSPRTGAFSPRPISSSSSPFFDPAGNSNSGFESSSNGPSLGDSRRTESVVARISTHTLRLEREYHLCRTLFETADPGCNHVVHPLDFVKLPSERGDRGPVIVSIFRSPGENYLKDLVSFGPAWYKSVATGGANGRRAGGGNGLPAFSPSEQVSLPLFLDFAVGASECLELLHHSTRTIHGEIRADAFHFNQRDGCTRIVNFGSGARSFEHGLTSTGWSSLSREVGVKNKLQFIAPEQTGRTATTPDTRTDIYSLGVLFWTILTQHVPHEGDTPMDVVQSVLSRRIPAVAAKRMDIPDVVSALIQKMTNKNVDERYQSASGLKYDLLEIQRLLGDGDGEGLKNFNIATKDVSSYFTLPKGMIGRQAEHDTIVRIIHKVSRRRESARDFQRGLYSISSNSSVSADLNANNANAATGHSLEQGDGSSDGGDRDSVSGHGRTGSASGPVGATPSPGFLGSLPNGHQNSYDSQDSVPTQVSISSSKPNNNNTPGSGSPAPPEDPAAGPSSVRSKPSAHTGTDRTSSMDGHDRGTASHQHPSITASTSTHRRRNSRRGPQKGRCEVVSVVGAAGLGKSCLVQSVQAEARRYGYFASAKFDFARKQPFEPVLKVMSSLFRQIFSEHDISTEFHNVIRNYVRPVWSMLYPMLDLPEFLLGTATGTATGSGMLYPPHGKKSSMHSSSPAGRRASSPSALSNTPTHSSGGGHFSSATPTELIPSNSTKPTRFMNTFLDVLRLLARHKFICLCIDDLQFADEESLELISNIVASKIKLALIVTYRQEEMLTSRVRSVLESENANLTRIELRPLDEDDIVQFVATTLQRGKEYVFPLAVVLQEKTEGNVFFLREMLDTCYRKGCLWYEWKSSSWVYDLDRVFKQFETESYGQRLNNDFITTRLTELPRAARCILAWASLIGTVFSFRLIERMFGGEFDYPDDEEGEEEMGKEDRVLLSQENAVAGLQAALQAYIIVPCDEDDLFRFAHDRYLQSSVALRECRDINKMHFMIAQTMMKYSDTDDRDLYTRCGHMCKAASLIRQRIPSRMAFREELMRAGQASADNGARSSALYYFRHCIELLQPHPWREDVGDASYEETLHLHTRTAECYWLTGRMKEALGTVQTIFEHARSALDKTPAFILQSRIYAKTGDSHAGFRALKQCLAELGMQIEDSPSWEGLDGDFAKLKEMLSTSSTPDLLNRPFVQDGNIVAIAALLVDAVSAAYWADALVFYQLAMKMVWLFFEHGAFPQAGLAFVHCAAIAAGRFDDVALASQLGDLAESFISKVEDSFVFGRGTTIYWFFVGHLYKPLRSAILPLEAALEASLATGDQIVSALAWGATALFKFGAEDTGDVEAFCSCAPDGLRGGRGTDLRGGTVVMAVRQAARALQGRTRHADPGGVMSDDTHDAGGYMAWIGREASNPQRSIDAYNCLAIIPVYLFGHHAHAAEIGRRTLDTVDELWSLRMTRGLLFYHSLALIGLIRRAELDPGTRQAYLAEVDKSCRRIEAWCPATGADPPNDRSGDGVGHYSMWSTLLRAELFDIDGNYGSAIQAYEAALTYAQESGLSLEEALMYELMGLAYIRHGARRAAQSFIRDSVNVYRGIGAHGKAAHLDAQCRGLLDEKPISRTAEAGVQTDPTVSAAYRRLDVEGNQRQIARAAGPETSQDRTREWLGPGLDDDSAGTARAGGDGSRVGRNGGGGGVGTRADRVQSKTAGDADDEDDDELSGLSLDVIDLTSLLNSNRLISEKLDVEELLPQMVDIILDSGQATFAATIIEDASGEWVVAAYKDSDSGRQSSFMPGGIPLGGGEVEDVISKQIALYCLRFREKVFIQNILLDERFSNAGDGYLARHPGGRSVIALPIVHGDTLLGALYVEGEVNGLTDRNLTVFQLLAHQLSISVQNAALYRNVKKVSASNASMIESQKVALAKARAAEAAARAAEHKAKTAEQEALRNLQLKEEAAKAKSIFLANVSHELRTPLNGVIGMSELLKGTPMTKEQDGYADSIRVCADTLLTVINDILDYSKLEAGKMQLVAIPFNLGEAIQEVVRALSCTHQDSGLKTIERLQLPPTLVYGDPVRLHQIMMNLLSNSYKFTPGGVVTVSASVLDETPGGIKVTCSVADTGIGISAEQVKRLFLPFSQADNSTARKYGGSGLGLSICKSLITVMGGQIGIKSTPGVGTTVTFTVTFPKVTRSERSERGDPGDGSGRSGPATAPVESTSAPTSHSAHIDLSRIPRDQLRICIAEDNPINQKIAISFVQKLGFQVDAYENGRQAIDALRSRAAQDIPYHLVLMDVQMPELEGYEATRILRRDPDPRVRQVVVIAMTASAIRGDRERCLEAGMNNYLAKPVRAKVLKEMLEQYLQQPAREMVDLQAEANGVARRVMQGGVVASGVVAGDASDPERSGGPGGGSGGSGGEGSVSVQTNSQGLSQTRTGGSGGPGVKGSISSNQTTSKNVSGWSGGPGIKESVSSVQTTSHDVSHARTGGTGVRAEPTVLSLPAPSLRKESSELSPKTTGREWPGPGRSRPLSSHTPLGSPRASVSGRSGLPGLSAPGLPGLPNPPGPGPSGPGPSGVSGVPPPGPSASGLPNPPGPGPSAPGPSGPSLAAHLARFDLDPDREKKAGE